MSQVLATITLGPDPGSRAGMLTYHAWFVMQATGQELNVSIKQNGVPVATSRFSPGDPGNFRVDIAAPFFIGPQSGNFVYTAELDWGAGAGGQAATFGDPAFNRFAILVFGTAGP